jgi:hypothetical protein
MPFIRFVLADLAGFNTSPAFFTNAHLEGLSHLWVEEHLSFSSFDEYWVRSASRLDKTVRERRLDEFEYRVDTSFRLKSAAIVVSSSMRECLLSC